MTLLERASDSGGQCTQLRPSSRIRSTAGLLGPAFVASVAYLDPGNFATDFAGGAEHGYQLVWVVVAANLMAFLVQYLSSKAGLATGHSLPELCRQRFGRRACLLLWAQAEAVAMATDLAEFVGAAVGLRLIFGVPLLPAGLITAVAAFAILGLDRRGHRRYELAIAGLLILVGSGFGYLLLVTGGQDYQRLAGGLVPNLAGHSSLVLSVAILGATIMPHVVYLHSALLSERAPSTGGQDRRSLLSFNRWDCVLGFGFSGLVNLTMLCLAAALFQLPGRAALTDLVSIHQQLSVLVGGGAALAFGIALMASGLSSSSVGTQAGQLVMTGFTGWRVPLPVRRAVTMVPSLIVLACTDNTGQALVYSQIALSFGIPFALLPLLLVTRDRPLMADLTNRWLTSTLMLLVTTVVSGLNCYLIWTALGAG